MRSLTFEEITPDEFDSFSAAHPQGNFQQTSHMGALREKSGTDVSYVGAREGGNLVAAALVETHRSSLSTFAEVHDGPLMDFHDEELVTFFFDALKRFVKQHGAAQLEITPEVVYRVRDSLGKPLPPDGDALPAGVPAGSPREADDETVAVLERLGFIHSGFTTGYTAVPRWRYVKDLTGISGEQELLASYAKNTKRNVRIARESMVKVTRIKRDELPTFHAICEMSCEKQGFANRPLDYFEAIYDAFGDDAEFLVAFIDTEAYLASWQKKQEGFAADVERFEHLLETSPSPEKVEKKLSDARSKLESSIKRVASAEEYRTHGALIPAAAALFIWGERECIYLFSGSDPVYAKFYAASAIQHQIMCECLERGVSRYNFYGINGIFDDPQDSGRGLLEFKQGFNGFVEEMVGEFLLPVKPLTFKLKQAAHRLMRN